MSFTLDASAFHCQDQNIRAQYIRDLLQSLLETGHVRLKNHGIPDHCVREAFDWAHRFFELPQAAKADIANEPGPNPQRGYSSRGAESTAALFGSLLGNGIKNGSLQDAREHFDTGAPDDDEFPNKYPSEDALPGLETFMVNFYRRCETVSFDILGALEEALSLPAESFTSRCKPRNASELRFNRYPEISLEEMRAGDTRRIWPHFDLGVITMLFTDSVGGLEFQDRRAGGTDAFVPVQEGSQTDIILNISETMQRWTHDHLPASLHQVTIPPEMKNLSDGVIPTRYSVAYFVKAHRNASVGALKPFVPTHGTTQYHEMTALEYHQQRLQTAY